MALQIHMRATYDYIKGSAFVFEVDGLCICHTGDLGEPFNEDQLDLIGHIDIVFVPIGGSYTMGPESAKKVVDQLKPRIAVPMHYYNDTMVLERFLNGPNGARFLETDSFSVSKDEYQLREIWALYSGWHDSDTENTFDWNLAN